MGVEVSHPVSGLRVCFGTRKTALFDDGHEGQGCPSYMESEQQGHLVHQANPPERTALIARLSDHLGGKAQGF